MNTAAAKRALVLAAVALGIAGCAAMSARQTETTRQMLGDAGFELMQADTPEKVSHLKALPPRTIVRRERSGAPSYAYADADGCKCLYVGTKDNYHAYRKLARDRQNAAVAAAVDEQASDPRGWSVWGLWP